MDKQGEAPTTQSSDSLDFQAALYIAPQELLLAEAYLQQRFASLPMCTFMQALKKACSKENFQLKGRISRDELFILLIPYWMLNLCYFYYLFWYLDEFSIARLMYFEELSFESLSWGLVGLVLFAFQFIITCSMVRRFHDTGKNGALALSSFVIDNCIPLSYCLLILIEHMLPISAHMQTELHSTIQDWSIAVYLMSYPLCAIMLVFCFLPTSFKANCYGANPLFMRYYQHQQELYNKACRESNEATVE